MVGLPNGRKPLFVVAEEEEEEKEVEKGVEVEVDEELEEAYFEGCELP